MHQLNRPCLTFSTRRHIRRILTFCSAPLFFSVKMLVKNHKSSFKNAAMSLPTLYSMVAPDDEILVLKYKNLVDGFFTEIFADRNNPEGQINIETNYFHQSFIFGGAGRLKGQTKNILTD